MKEPVRIGVVGGGLMGKELLALSRRWDALVDHPVRPDVVAVADPAPKVARWWQQAGVATVTDDYHHLLQDPGIDVLYVAVPHDLHEQIYLDAVVAGKDFVGRSRSASTSPRARALSPPSTARPASSGCRVSCRTFRERNVPAT